MAFRANCQVVNHRGHRVAQGTSETLADHVSVPLGGAGIRRADSPWAPLREPVFRSLWIAAVVSYTGTWMQNVGAGWLMTQLSVSPLMVSLVQAAAAIPVFLVVLPAGALADMVDRRRLLLFTQSWMVVAAVALGVLTLFHAVSPWMLAGIYVSDGPGGGDERSGVAGDYAGSGFAAASCLGGGAELGGLQRGTSGGSCVGWTRGGGCGIGLVVFAQRCFILRSDPLFVHMEMCAARAISHAWRARGDSGRFPICAGSPSSAVGIDSNGSIQLRRDITAGIAARGLPTARSAGLRLPADVLRAWSSERGRRAAADCDCDIR